MLLHLSAVYREQYFVDFEKKNLNHCIQKMILRRAGFKSKQEIIMRLKLKGFRDTYSYILPLQRHEIILAIMNYSAR